jgi:hypothetical protein
MEQPLLLEWKSMSNTGKLNLSFNRPIKLRFDLMELLPSPKSSQRKLQQIRTEDQKLTMLLANITNAFELKYDPNPANPTLDEHFAELLAFNVTEFKDMKEFVI